MGDDMPMMPGSDYNVGEAFTGMPVLGKPSQNSQQATQAALLDALGMSMALWNETEGMRKHTSKALTDFTRGDFDPATHPMFSGQKAGIEGAYNTARENIVSNVPAGGVLSAELGNLESDRAQDLTGLYSDIQSDMFNKAYGAGYGTPQTSISGMNASSGNMMQYMAAQQAAAGQNAQGAGMLIGSMMSK